MKARARSRCVLLAVVALIAAACQLPRPDTVPSRMLEPSLLEPVTEASKAADAVSVRLLDTQARGHIGRRLLHQQPDGELGEDPVWRWSSTPDRYLDTALRLDVASRADLRLVDTSRAPTLSVTLLAWHLQAQQDVRLVGIVEVRVTDADRTVHTQILEESEPVTGELPGDLADVSGRLLRRLAAESLAYIPRLPR